VLGAAGRVASTGTRLFTLIRSALWQPLDLRQLLDHYGTAGDGGRLLGTSQQAYGMEKCLINTPA